MTATDEIRAHEKEAIRKRLAMWRLIAFAGWFVAGLLATGDVVGWGRWGQ